MALWYLGNLLWETLKAAAAVGRLALTPGAHPEPVLVEFRSGLQSEALNVILANSITLTPGTITMEIAEEGEQTYYYVHWIKAESDGAEAGEAIKGRMEKWIRRFWQ